MTEYDDEALRTKTDEFLEFNQVLREYRWKEIEKHLWGTTILEVGCGHPYMIQQLFKISGLDVWGIDPDPERLEKTRREFPEVSFTQEKLEKFVPPYPFDTIICSHVIEHTNDPLEFLTAARRNIYISPKSLYNGKVIITCPNARSLHKRVSEISGFTRPLELSATDTVQGHKWSFNRLELESLVEGAGFEIEVSKGIMLKPFPNAMMTDLISRRFADALYEIGKDPALTDYCSSLLIVARPR